MIEAQWHPSPNWGERLHAIEYIILHGTWMADEAEALARLCDPVAEVSCHYLINQNGSVYQLVQEDKVAWHAGVSRWDGKEGINQYSLGIELSNPGDPAVPYTEDQYRSLSYLLESLLRRYHLGSEAVLAHSDIAPERKMDPGPHFEWARLAEQGLALEMPHFSQGGV